MKNVTQDFKDTFLSGRQKNLTLTFSDGTVLTNNHIFAESMEIEQTLCDEEQLQFGKCSANSFKIIILADNKTYLGKTFVATLQCGDYTQNLGTYKVAFENKSADRLEKELIGYDSIYEIANTNVADWYNSLNFGTISNPTKLSIKTIRDSLFDYLDIEQVSRTLINDNIMVGKTIEANVISGLDVIQAICEINGVFGNINFDGKFDYVSLTIPSSYSDRNYTADDYYNNSLDYADFTTQTIGKVVIKENSEDVGYSYGSGNEYNITGNFLTYGKSKSEKESIAQTILNKIENISYVPVYSLDLQGNVWMELGDYIQVTSIHQDIIEFPILVRVLSGITALKDSFTAEGTKEYSEGINGLLSDIKTLKSKTTTIEETEKGLVKTVSEIDENYYDKNDLENDLDSYYNNNIKDTLDNLQEQIDGTKETFMGEEVPTLNNYPANTWDTKEKQRHVGSVYYDKDGKSYRFMYNIFYHGTTIENGKEVPNYLTYQGDSLVEYLWQPIANDDVTKALEDSAKALNELGVLENKVVTEYYTKTETEKVVTDEIDKVETTITQNYYTKAYLDDEYKVEIKDEVASEIEQTSSSIHMAVKGMIDEQYSKIEVGAANLILNSEDFSGNSHKIINSFLTYQGNYLTYKGSYLFM